MYVSWTMCIYSADSLACNIHNWKTIGASKYVQRIILEDVRVPFSSKPESFILRNRIFGLRESSFITEEVNTFSKRGYISKTPDRPFCVSLICCVPKKVAKSGPVFTKCLSQGLGLKLRLLSQVSAQKLLSLLS